MYLDSVGMLASLGNRWLLQQSAPGRRQIAVWDKIMVRGSWIIDLLMGYRVS